MNNLFSKSIAVFSLVFVSAAASQANAQSYHHIDELAQSINVKAGMLLNEANSHYRHSPEYRHLVSDARNLRRLASHMHEVAHHHGSLSHLAADLRELDVSFHHMESVFDRIEHEASHGHGHVHGNTAHVKSLLNSIENSIHHLKEDIRKLRAPRRCPHTGRIILERPVYRGGGHGGGHGGGGYGGGGHGGGHGSFSIGGGSSKIRIRF